MKGMTKLRMLALAGIIIAALAEPFIVHATESEETALYPVSVYLQDSKRDLVYPSVADSFLVYNEKGKNGFSVVRVPVDQPDLEGKRMDPTALNEVIRYGVAVQDGGIADLHYNINGGAQQNVRMSTVDGHHQYDVSNLNPGDVVNFFVTVINGPAYDTAWQSHTF